MKSPVFISSIPEPDSIIIDADDTNADTYGAQQLTLFNAYYGEYCYMPLLLFEGRSVKLILPVLRPGRGDSHFCFHDFMDWATDRQDGIHFITGLAGNVKLQKITAHWLDTAVASHKATWRTLSTGEWQYLFNYGNYKNDIRKGKCACGVTVCGREACVVLLPDDWQWNEDAVGICGFSVRLVTECP